MLTAKKLLTYKSDLERAVNERSSEIFFNDSILHAMLIMKALLQKAQNEDSKLLSVYCGNFSLFRDKTKIKVDNEKMNCSANNLEANELEEWQNWDLYTDLQNKLRDFLNNGGHLDLIVQYQADDLPDNKVWRILSDGIQKEKVRIFQLKINVGLDHFATTQEAYRLENSDETKTATCCFCDEKNARILNDNFKELIKLSEPFVA